MQGKRTLFPLGYHCTGLPIKASADKLVKEVEMFGRDFERYKAEDEEEVIAAPAAKGPKDDLSKFNAKKGKAAAKTVKAKYQFQILHSVGIPLEEIHLFADPQYWSVPSPVFLLMVRILTPHQAAVLPPRVQEGLDKLRCAD